MALQLALGLVHNQGVGANRRQINDILPLVVIHYEPPGSDFDTHVWYWYSLAGLLTDHEVKFYQAVPFGIAEPDNLYLLDSYKVLYAQGDEDKVGNHARFLNWLIKRATDNGAGTVIYVRNSAAFSVASLAAFLALLVGNVVFAEPPWGKLATVRLLREVGPLVENVDLDLAVDDLKIRITAAGLLFV